MGNGKGWRLVNAKVVGARVGKERQWVYDPDSPAKILVCEDHKVVGEPKPSP